MWNSQRVDQEGDKIWSIKKLLNKIEVFSILNNKDIFNNVVVDSGGYGIS